MAAPFVAIVAACCDGVNASEIGRSKDPTRGPLAFGALVAPVVPVTLQAASTRPAAMDVLALTLESIPDDIPVILDAKRGDVPNTAAAYARALFDKLRADAVTAAPYIGLDAIAPFCEPGRYAFVLARTSNPGAGDFQDLEVAGRPLYERIVERCVERFPSERCGFVVASTYPDEARRIAALEPDRLV